MNKTLDRLVNGVITVWGSSKTIKVMGTMILGAAAGGLISANVIPDKPDEVVLENKLEEGENNYDEVK